MPAVTGPMLSHVICMLISGVQRPCFKGSVTVGQDVVFVIVRLGFSLALCLAGFISMYFTRFFRV